MNSKQTFNVVSLSGGKDSTAMLLKMIEENMPIDCILFCDTGLEFPQMYEHLDKLERDIGRKICRIKAEKSFEYLMFDVPIKRRSTSNFTEKNGYSWAGPRQRWCTTLLKDNPREKFLRELRKNYDVKEYVGLAADEQYRLERARNRNPNHVHPLVDFGMTEADCLKYCYERGYDWGGLYEIFSRVSCWCCPLQSLDELRKLYTNFPELWQKLKEWDKRTWRKFRADYSVEELEVRFNFERERIAEGKTIKGREFFDELKERLNANDGKT